MNNDALISLQNAVPATEFRFAEPVSLELRQGENWIVFGSNGSGKTTLADMLRGAVRLQEGRLDHHFGNKMASESISYVTFHDQYSTGVDTGASAYQMRWNQGAMDEEFEPRVRDLLRKADKFSLEMRTKILEMPDLSQMLDRTVVSLSSGEFRRVQLIKALLQNPQVLIIDNPFIGLDVEGRDTIVRLLERLAADSGICIVLLLSRMPEKLQNFTHIVEISDGVVQKRPLHEKKSLKPVVVEARNVTIRYGKRTILRDFNITIREGEHWALKGANGSGKSTLLSLICADNPQSYACDITLFGRRRGTGESIWEIKRNIGFVSPEMFRAYRRSLPVKDIVASGLHDTTGLFRKAKSEDYERISEWLVRFGIEAWAERNYLTLSSGEQRFVLLCRAFVKQPALLILDEPFHGLDDDFRRRANDIICNYCADPTRTLIMVSHYDEDFPPLIDRTIHLHKITD